MRNVRSCQLWFAKQCMNSTPLCGLSRKATDDVQMGVEDFLPRDCACIPTDRPSRWLELVKKCPCGIECKTNFTPLGRIQFKRRDDVAQWHNNALGWSIGFYAS